MTGLCCPCLPDTNTNFVYSLVVAGGLVGWLVFCYTAVRCVYKNIKRERLPRQLLSLSTEVSVIGIPLPVVHNENIYDEIEEVPSSYLTAYYCPSYFSVKDDCELSLKSSITETNSFCEACVYTQKNEDFEHADYLSENSQESLDGCNANKNEDYYHHYTTIQDDNKSCSYTN
ncbi:Hypothetical predicted protein [Mytilus galloprovincialis]|uniref:Uncharacterized protein n=1 Tax=Mytilus galloprovincialis TaxID=29158 RepID=A0A8B6FAB9_MYTGA|nr:Hypothetical predicted protein [Mytilus galloprovincialis]